MAEVVGFITASLILLGVIGVLWSLRGERFSLVTITKGDTELAGIPFYTKQAVCKHEVVWVEPLFTVTYTKTTKYQFVEPPDEKQKAPEAIIQSASKSVSLSQFRGPHMRRLCAMVAATAGGAPTELVDAIDATWNEFSSGEVDYVPLGKSVEKLVEAGDAVLIADTVSVEVITDYSSVHYYNAERPLIGSGEVSVKLNADGTLSESSAKVESKSIESLLNFVPVKDLMGLVKGVPVADKPTTDERRLRLDLQQKVERVIQLQLTITQKDYRHILTSYMPYDQCPKPNGKPFSMRIETPSDSAAKKPAENTVEVSGTITLPTKPKGDEKSSA
jgi:hypothetical protein